MQSAQLEATYGRATAILLRACRVYLGTDTSESLQSFLNETPVDWREVHRLTKAHRITPIAFRILLSCHPPAPWATIFKNELQRRAINSMDKAKETARLVSLLQTAGLSVFPYKGLAFSLLFYGDIGMRESGDIDLIVKPAELPLVNEILKADGYLPEEEDFVRFLGWERFARTRRGYNLKKLDRSGLPIHLELHWRVIYDYLAVGNFDNNFSYITNEYLQVYDQMLPVQDHFEQFKYLYLHHSVHDGYGYLKTALDIAMGLRKLNPAAEDYTRHPLLRELTEVFSLAAAVEASNRLFGTQFALPAHQRQEKLSVRLVDTTLKEKRLVSKQMGTNFVYYMRYYTGLIRKRALFYPEPHRKIQSYFHNFIHFFQPTVEDFRLFKPKSLVGYRLLWLFRAIRPFRHLVQPTDPLQRKKDPKKKP